jgi:hypothetical protein
MKTAVTMLGEAFRQWQKDWDSYDKGIGDKPKSYDEFISPFIELEKEQIVEAYDRGYKACDLDEALEINKTMFSGEGYYEQTYKPETI